MCLAITKWIVVVMFALLMWYYFRESIKYEIKNIYCKHSKRWVFNPITEQWERRNKGDIR